MSRLTRPLLVAYVALIAYTLLRAPLGLDFQIWTVVLSPLLGLAFALLHARERHGWPRALLILAIVVGVAALAEWLGVATGALFGPYHYTATLGPRFLGPVPYAVLLAWFMMVYPAYVIVDRLTPRRWSWPKRRLAMAALAGLAMVAWDLGMDPLMARQGHWVWEVEGAYFGVPLQNFWGWWLTTFVAVWLVVRFAGAGPAKGGRADQLAVAFYAFTGLGNAAGALLAGLGGPALASLVAMAPWVWCGWLACGQAPAGHL